MKYEYGIGKYISYLAIRKGRTIKWLADEMSINYKTFLGKLQRDSITAMELLEIADILEIEMNEIKDGLDGKGLMSAKPTAGKSSPTGGKAKPTAGKAKPTAGLPTEEIQRRSGKVSPLIAGKICTHTLEDGTIIQLIGRPNVKLESKDRKYFKVCSIIKKMISNKKENEEIVKSLMTTFSRETLFDIFSDENQIYFIDNVDKEMKSVYLRDHLKGWKSNNVEDIIFEKAKELIEEISMIRNS